MEVKFFFKTLVELISFSKEIISICFSLEHDFPKYSGKINGSPKIF